MSSSERLKTDVEYESESELIQDYKKIISNSVNLNFACEYLFNSLVDDAILSCVFREHFESKYPDIFGSNHETEKASSSHSDTSSNKQYSCNCKCSNCDKVVSANKFASHLENCMGLGRNSSRIASRKKTNSSYYDYDDGSESDTNWNERKTKKKLGNGRNNGKNNKKNYNI